MKSYLVTYRQGLKQKVTEPIRLFSITNSVIPIILDGSNHVNADEVLSIVEIVNSDKGGKQVES